MPGVGGVQAIHVCLHSACVTVETTDAAEPCMYTASLQPTMKRESRLLAYAALSVSWFAMVHCGNQRRRGPSWRISVSLLGTVAVQSWRCTSRGQRHGYQRQFLRQVPTGETEKLGTLVLDI